MITIHILQIIQRSWCYFYARETKIIQVKITQKLNNPSQVTQVMFCISVKLGFCKGRRSSLNTITIAGKKKENVSPLC